MNLTLLACGGLRRASLLEQEPGFAAAWLRWLQDASRSALGRTYLYCPAGLALASLPNGAPEA